MAEEAVEAPPAELVHIETRGKPLARPRTPEDIETELFIGSGEVMELIVKHCADWPVDDDDAQRAIYESWRDNPDIGPDKANRIRNTVRAAWLGKKEAPVWLSIEQSLFVAGIKARAVKNQDPKTMNVQIVQMSAPMPAFKRKLIEE